MTDAEAFALLSPDQRATMDAVPDRVRVVLKSNAPRAQKYIRLVAIANHANAAAAPHTPCRRGCAHCCHIPVVVTQREALRIEAYSGRKAERLPNANEEPQVGLDRMRDNMGRYNGVACPFLGDADECTVYPVRPIACRTYHSLNPTPGPCDVRTGVHEIPRFGFQSIDMGVSLLDLRDPFGDIREFFP